MRLDKFLSNMNIGSRSDVKKLIKQKVVKLNNKVITNGKIQLDPAKDQVSLNNKIITYEPYKYLMLNKPQGVISATTDPSQKTVLDLIVPENQIKNLAPVGRLDKDTTGLLLLTNNGTLTHQLLAPQKHIAKTYSALISGIPTTKIIRLFKNGIDLKDGTQCKPALLKIIKSDPLKNRSQIQITITEGKYHQVKRMFAACNMKVLTLKRLSMGTLKLDPHLKEGNYRALTTTEKNDLLKK